MAHQKHGEVLSGEYHSIRDPRWPTKNMKRSFLGDTTVLEILGGPPKIYREVLSGGYHII